MKRQRLILRLDDAADRMDIKKWEKMEQLLDKYSIKPLVGVIPDCQDPKMQQYEKDPNFWDKVQRWNNKGRTIALHGYQHLYITNQGGINPINKKSEFAGLSLEKQRKKIREGIRILGTHNIKPNVFFAPGHTFDENTIKALIMETKIRVISDTIARDVYKKDDMTYIPVQSGQTRRLPFKTVTYCMHPNTTNCGAIKEIDRFLKKYDSLFINPNDATETVRQYDFIDGLLARMYFARR